MFDKPTTLTLALLAATTTTIMISSTTAQAGRFDRGYHEGNYVIAESNFGNGRVAGRVRRTRLGRQVQLPGGSWVDCSRSCRHTLRIKTVDFWQSEEGAGPGNELTHDGGIFGDLEIGIGRR